MSRQTINPKLMALPIDELAKLYAQVKQAVEYRRFELFRPGRKVWFQKRGHGINGIVTVRIERIAQTRIHGVELNERGIPNGKKWTCHPEMLNPVYEEAVVAPAAGTGADAPGYANAGSF